MPESGLMRRGAFKEKSFEGVPLAFHLRTAFTAGDPLSKESVEDSASSVELSALMRKSSLLVPEKEVDPALMESTYKALHVREAEPRSNLEPVEGSIALPKVSSPAVR